MLSGPQKQLYHTRKALFTDGCTKTGSCPLQTSREGIGGRILSAALNSAVALLFLAFAGRLSAQTPDGFNARANGVVFAMAVQLDGRIVAVGNFSSLAGQPRNCIGRFNQDGTLDPTFNPQVGGGYLCCLAVQPDGKIVVGGNIWSVAEKATGCLVRLNADGSLDTSFVDPGANGWVQTVALQADGKIVAGGGFHTLGGQSRWYLGRLNPDGTLDTTFTGGVADDDVRCVVVQADGKLVVGGSFNRLDGQLSMSYGRLNSDGTWDSSFRPNLREDVFDVYSLTLQADGKILVGGYFSSLGGASRTNIGRLNPDGTADSGFAPAVTGWVYSMIPQVDGKILVGTTTGGVRRFLANGSVDSGFSAGTDSGVFSITLQPDGKVLVSGEFSTLGGGALWRFGEAQQHGARHRKPGLGWLNIDLAPQRNGSGDLAHWL